MEAIKILIGFVCLLGVIIVCPILHFMGIETPTPVLISMATTAIFILVSGARDDLMLKLDVISHAFARGLSTSHNEQEKK